MNHLRSTAPSDFTSVQTCARRLTIARCRATVIGLALGFASLLHAATPEAAPAFEWATSAGGLKNDKTRCINVDAEGNIFLVGEATDEVKFGDVTVKSAGGMDFFVAKLDAKGQFIWARMVAAVSWIAATRWPRMRREIAT